MSGLAELIHETQRTLRDYRELTSMTDSGEFVVVAPYPHRDSEQYRFALHLNVVKANFHNDTPLMIEIVQKTDHSRIALLLQRCNVTHQNIKGVYLTVAPDADGASAAKIVGDYKISVEIQHAPIDDGSTFPYVAYVTIWNIAKNEGVITRFIPRCRIQDAFVVGEEMLAAFESHGWQGLNSYTHEFDWGPRYTIK